MIHNRHKIYFLAAEAKIVISFSIPFVACRHPFSSFDRAQGSRVKRMACAGFFGVLNGEKDW